MKLSTHICMHMLRTTVQVGMDAQIEDSSGDDKQMYPVLEVTSTGAKIGGDVFSWLELSRMWRAELLTFWWAGEKVKITDNENKLYE